MIRAKGRVITLPKQEGECGYALVVNKQASNTPGLPVTREGALEELEASLVILTLQPLAQPNLVPKNREHTAYQIQ
jgi:hypothetical protein